MAASQAGGTSSGMVVGLVAALIVCCFFIILVVMCIRCRNRHAYDHTRATPVQDENDIDPDVFTANPALAAGIGPDGDRTTRQPVG